MNPFHASLGVSEAARAPRWRGRASAVDNGDCVDLDQELGSRRAAWEADQGAIPAPRPGPTQPTGGANWSIAQFGRLNIAGLRADDEAFPSRLPARKDALRAATVLVAALSAYAAGWRLLCPQSPDDEALVTQWPRQPRCRREPGCASSKRRPCQLPVSDVAGRRLPAA